MSDAGRYRRIYPRLWLHPAFVSLAEGERLVALYLLSGPSTNRIGLFKLSPAAAAEDLGLSLDTFKRRFARVCEVFDWRFDAAARVLWVPSWWRFNLPANPNVLQAALADLAEVPASDLVDQFANHTETLPGTFGETFTACMAKRSTHSPVNVRPRAPRTGAGAGTGTQRELEPTSDNTETLPAGRQVHAFLKRFCDLYREHGNGARYHVQKTKDVPIVRALLTEYGSALLDTMAALLLTVDDDWIAGTDRGIGILSVKASWLATRLLAAPKKSSTSICPHEPECHSMGSCRDRILADAHAERDEASA